MKVQTDQAQTLDELLGNILGGERRGGPTPWGWHRWNDLLQCPRKYHLLYDCNQRPEFYSDALTFGGLLHECLATYYTETPSFLHEHNDAVADARYEAYCQMPRWQHLLDAVRVQGGEGYYEVVDDVQRVMGAYVQFYPMLHDEFLRYEITGVEEYIAVPGPFDFTTRADLVYRSAAGLWIVDHKTSRMLTEDLVSGWSINGQMLGLAYAAMHHWPQEQIRGLVINIIVRTKTPQFKRVVVPLRPDLIERWVEHMTSWTQQVLPTYASLGWPPNYASCIHRYGRCPFYGDCAELAEAAMPGEVDYSEIWEV